MSDVEKQDWISSWCQVSAVSCRLCQMVRRWSRDGPEVRKLESLMVKEEYVNSQDQNYEDTADIDLPISPANPILVVGDG